jgi:hypothetical protein
MLSIPLLYHKKGWTIHVPVSSRALNKVCDVGITGWKAY